MLTMTTPDNYITTNEAADELGVTRQRVLQLIQDGRLKAEKFANVYMIPRGALADIEGKPMGRPPGKPSTAQKAATQPATGSNAALKEAVKAKKKGKK
jgi:excisionase family DNA binding protein